MKRKSIYILLFVVCFGLLAAFVDFSAANAQTARTPTRAQTITPTPTPAPTKSVSASPTVSSTPEIEEDNEVYRIETEEVNLNVRVINRNNRPVNNIRQDEFKVYEDNVLQPITSFTKAEVPTNYSLVLDNSGSLRNQLEKIIEAGKIIVNTNKPADETSVIRFVSSDKIEIMQDFTPNKTDINEALDNLFVEGGQTAIIDAVYLAAEKVSEYEKNKNLNDKKRRALILVSDGEDVSSFYKEQQLFDLLRESEVQIFAVGFVNELSKDGGFISKSKQSKAKDFLERLAKETGGKSYFPNSINELSGIAQDIASELRTQYVVSYSPTNEKKDGSFRNIKVVVGDGANKEKRIAITRTGRNAVGDQTGAPALQRANPQIKNN